MALLFLLWLHFCSFARASLTLSGSKRSAPRIIRALRQLLSVRMVSWLYPSCCIFQANCTSFPLISSLLSGTFCIMVCSGPKFFVSLTRIWQVVTLSNLLFMGLVKISLGCSFAISTQKDANCVGSENLNPHFLHSHL